jgi:excisionase family DNA binding protein
MPKPSNNDVELDAPRRSYSTTYVARRLGVSQPTVQRWVDSGRLRAWKTLGGHRRVDAESADSLFRQQEHAPSALASAEPTRVLVVEDNLDDRDILCALCQQLIPDCELTVAENGYQALLLMGQTPPHVLITDIVMPHMDGREMLMQLERHAPVRPELIIVASSLSAEQVAKMGPLPQDAKLLRKPVSLADFEACLKLGAEQGLTR